MKRLVLGSERVMYAGERALRSRERGVELKRFVKALLSEREVTSSLLQRREREPSLSRRRRLQEHTARARIITFDCVDET